MLITANCPHCFEKIMLDDTEMFGFCLHCGKKINLEQLSSSDNISLSENSIEKGRQYLLEENYEEAERIFDALLQHYPKNHEVLWGKFRSDDGILSEQYKGCITINDKRIDLRKIIEANPAAKLNAIKELKIVSGLGLKQCKDIIDAAYPRSGELVYSIRNLTVKEAKALEEAALGRTSSMPPITAKNLEYANNAIAYAPEQMKNHYSKKLNERQEKVINIKIDPDKGACYIATAVYGSYDAPEVIVLRHFRDHILARSVAGRLFIHCYYFISPPLARQLQTSSCMNLAVKKILNKLVKKIAGNITTS